MKLNNASPVKTIFSSLASHFMVVFEGGNEVYIYRWQRATEGTASTFIFSIPLFFLITLFLNNNIVICRQIGSYNNWVWSHFSCLW